MNLFALTIFLVTVLCFVGCSKILFVLPAPSPSHFILGRRLAEGLTDRGHEITFISPYDFNYQPKNGSLRFINTGISSNAPLTTSGLFNWEKTPIILIQYYLNFLGIEATKNVIENEDVQKLLHSDEKFDVVITIQFLFEGLKYFAHHFNAHLVILNTFGPNTWVNDVVGNPTAYAYVPQVMTNNTHKTFWERLHNFLIHILMKLNARLIVFPQHDRLIKNYFPNSPDLYGSIYNASLVLLNSHISTNHPVPIVPCMVEIGGFHVSPPKKLPEDLQKFLDDAKEGVIYFSMGSNLKSSHLPQEKLDIFLNVFSKRKEKILWKFEKEELPGKPPNVFLRKWLPQQGVLAHPNVKLFITHGGLLSTIETVYYAKPILAIPVFAEQELNAAYAVNQGYALSVSLNSLDEKVFEKKLNELISNGKYRDRIKTISDIFHDRPQKPLDTALYWIEYVIRHNGAKHLRVAALELTWYQNASLDVIGFILLVLITIIYLSYVFIKICYRKLFSKKTPKQKEN